MSSLEPHSLKNINTDQIISANNFSKVSEEDGRLLPPSTLGELGRVEVRLGISSCSPVQSAWSKINWELKMFNLV